MFKCLERILKNAKVRKDDFPPKCAMQQVEDVLRVVLRTYSEWHIILTSVGILEILEKFGMSIFQTYI